MADEPEQIVYEVRVEGAEEAIRALKEGEADDVRFIIITIREVKPWHGLLQ
jgi:hypothetical protein